MKSLDQVKDQVLFEGGDVGKDMLEIIWSAPEKGCDGDVKGLWEEFPGHLHIDILPSHQRQGFGRQLITALLEQLKSEGCRGVYLGVGRENIGAIAFYERNGFSRYDKLEQDGELGRKGGTIVMTKLLT